MNYYSRITLTFVILFAKLIFCSFVLNQQIYLGCYLDNDLKRDINSTFYQDSTNLTIENCAAFCYSNFLPYCGLQLKYIHLVNSFFESNL